MTNKQLDYLVEAGSVHMTSVENPGSRLGQPEAYISEENTGTSSSTMCAAQAIHDQQFSHP